jgi:hypothetical protein
MSIQGFTQSLERKQQYSFSGGGRHVGSVMFSQLEPGCIELMRHIPSEEAKQRLGTVQFLGEYMAICLVLPADDLKQQTNKQTNTKPRSNVLASHRAGQLLIPMDGKLVLIRIDLQYVRVQGEHLCG